MSSSAPSLSNEAVMWQFSRSLISAEITAIGLLTFLVTRQVRQPEVCTDFRRPLQLCKIGIQSPSRSNRHVTWKTFILFYFISIPGSCQDLPKFFVLLEKCFRDVCTHILGLSIIHRRTIPELHALRQRIPPPRHVLPVSRCGSGYGSGSVIQIATKI